MVHGLDQHEDGSRDDEEVEDLLQERSVFNKCHFDDFFPVDDRSLPSFLVKLGCRQFSTLQFVLQGSTLMFGSVRTSGCSFDTGVLGGIEVVRYDSSEQLRFNM